jgi:putative GTP pyrophosphokinase
MTEVEFIERFRAEKKHLESYANFVSDKIKMAIISSLKINPDTFFKIPITFRLKDEDSLIQKAFYRNKNYSNPYNEITDKVGGRIVVLLEEQANQVCRTIESLEDFVFSKDRDFEIERAKHPELFDYKSHHYILRNKHPITEGELIPEGTPIEIQIRTLLQHAYSELTHDTIYKPNTAAAPEVRRYVAKSMALIEVTDQLFSQVSNSLKQSEHQFSKIIEDCLKLLPADIELNTDKDLCNFILDAFLSEVEIYSYNNLRKFVSEYSFILQKIRERSKYKYLFRQPIILFIYYLVLTKRKIAKSKWPLSVRDIEEVFIDLGYAYDKS